MVPLLQDVERPCAGGGVEFRTREEILEFGAAVLGFTIIAIIFTLPPFMTNLFALSVDGLQKHQVDRFIRGLQNGSSEKSVTRAYTTTSESRQVRLQLSYIFLWCH